MGVSANCWRKDGLAKAPFTSPDIVIFNVASGPKGAQGDLALVHRHAVDMHRAGTARCDAVSALGSGQAREVAKHPKQWGGRIGVRFELLSVTVIATMPGPHLQSRLARRGAIRLFVSLRFQVRRLNIRAVSHGREGRFRWLNRRRMEHLRAEKLARLEVQATVERASE